MRRERIIAFFDNLAEITLLILTIFVLLIYGAMQDYLSTVICIAALVCLCSWLTRFVVTGTVYWVKTGLIVPFALLIGIAALHIIRLPAPLAAVMSPHVVALYKTVIGEHATFLQQISLFPYQAYAGVYHVLFYGIIFFVIVNVVYEKEYVNKYLGAVVSIAVVLGALWLIQFIASDFSDVLINFLNCREDTTSLLFNRDYFLWFSLIPFFFTVGLLCADDNRERKALFAVAVIILFLALLLSGEIALYRGVICGAVFFSSVMLVTSSAKKIVKSAGAIGIVGLGVVLFLQAGAVLALIPDVLQSGGERSDAPSMTWSAVVALIQKAGLAGAGVGVGTNLSLFGTVPGTSAELLIVEYGVLGVLACGALIAVYFWKNLRMLPRRNDLFVKMVSVGGLSGIVALLYGGCVKNPFGSPAVLFICIVSAAFVFVLLRIRFVDVSENDDGVVYFDVDVIKLRPAVIGVCSLVAIGMIVLVSIPVVRMHLALYQYRKSTYKIPIESYKSAETAYSSILGFMGGEAYLKRREQCLLTAIELDPKNPLYYFELGRFYQNTERLSKIDNEAKARAAFEQACALDPFNPQYANGGAQPVVSATGKESVPMQEKQPKVAVKMASGAIDALHADALALLKKSKGSRDTLVQALEACRKVVAADPARAEQVLAACVKRTSDYDLLKLVVKDIKNAPEILALFLYNRNVWEKNEKKFTRDMWETPDNQKYPYYAAQAEMSIQTGNYRGAITFMEEFLKKCPDNAEANYWIAEKSSYYPKQYGQEYTEKFFTKALLLAPDAIEYQIGHCKYLYSRKRYQSAADALLKLTDKAENKPEVFFLLGQCYEQLSSRERAVDMYKKVLSIDPNHIEAKAKVESLKK